jgi:sporulation protein YlmC with PRC-barrel domain
MDVIRDVLDNQLVDRNQRKMGKVDGIVVELREGKPPRLAYLEVGLPVLARRLHPRLEHWITAIENKWGAKHSEPVRIPWSKVQDIGIDVDVNVEAEETAILAWEKWLREKVIKRIPGGN